MTKLKAFADDKLLVSVDKNSVDDKLSVDKMTISFFDRVENTGGKRENAGYQHFLLFPKCFPKPSS